MKNEERLLFEGYLYGNEEDVQLAKDEKKKAMFIESKINYDDLQTTLKVKKNLITVTWVVANLLFLKN